MGKLLNIGLSTSPKNGLAKALRRRFDCIEIPFEAPNINEEIQQQVASFLPDVIFMQIQTPDVISVETAKFMKQHGAFAINWYGDIRNSFPEWTKELGKHIDLTCFSNMNYVNELRDAGIVSEYLQTGYDIEIYRADGRRLHDYDVVFMGNDYGNQFPLSGLRRYMCEYLQQVYGDKFGLYGRGFTMANGDCMNEPETEAAIYRGAKIGINLSHFDYTRCSSSRLYRMMGCGICVLTKWYPEIWKDFEDGKHLVVWDTRDELKDKIDYYLKNEGERQRIASEGNRLARKKFTYDAMVKNILDLW